MTDRIVLHLDMDAFFASCEISRRPELAGQPVIVGADPKAGRGRGVVTAASYPARVLGVRAGMPISTAWQKAPHAVFLATDHAFYRSTSRTIFDGLRSDLLVEQVSVDEAYVDATDWTTWDQVASAAQELQRRVALSSGGMSCSIGAAPNKLVAKIASDIRKPHGVTIVPPASVPDFLDPLEVGRIPGIGPRTQTALEQAGVTTIAELRATSVVQLREWFGVHGAWMHEAAHGRHTSAVTDQWTPSKSMSEERTFARDERDPSRIIGKLRRMMEDLEEDLVRGDYWFRSITVKLRYSDFRTLSRQASLPHPSQDTTLARRHVLAILAPLLSDPRPVRLVGLRLGDLSHGLGQREIASYARSVPEAARLPFRTAGQMHLTNLPLTACP